MKKVKICFCEPFLLSGILPTLASPTLLSAVKQKGYEGKIFYPSITFFLEKKLWKDELLMTLADDIPLQIVDYLFDDDAEDSIRSRLLQELPLAVRSTDVIEHIIELRIAAQTYVKKTAKEIADSDPNFVCVSLTFGGYHFVNMLFDAIRQHSCDAFFLLGGSSCTPDIAKKQLKAIPKANYILCDETPSSLLEIIGNLSLHREPLPTCAASIKHAPLELRTLVDMDNLPVPDFSDFFALTDCYGIKRSDITLPYEISRGCWWCEQKPCSMCGFFGTRNKYICKSPKKVISDLQTLSELWHVYKYRFSDLVQPKAPFLQKLLPLEYNYFHLFWEIRPDITLQELKLLRRIGMTFAQVGIESLCTEALKHMNKGTTGIHNIELLVWAQTLKIDLFWNYLYGLPDDQVEWYTKIADLIPHLLHLAPPIPRKMWYNKYSTWASDLSDGLSVFLGHSDNGKRLEKSYTILCDAIETWRISHKRNFSLQIDGNYSDGIHIIRNYEQEEHFYYYGKSAELYQHCFQADTVSEAAVALSITEEQCSSILSNFVKNGLMVFLDGYYLSVAEGNSLYRWTRPEEQVLDNSFFKRREASIKNGV